MHVRWSQLLFVLLVTTTCARGARTTAATSENGQRLFAEQLTTLAGALANLDSALASSAKPDSALDAFKHARTAYKHVEPLLMYYVPIQASAINGPRAEDDDNPNAPVRSAAIGFQVVEAALFDGSITRDSARTEMVRMRRVLESLRTVTRTNTIDRPALLDAAKLQLARTTVLGLAGFDADPSGAGITEAAESMDGIRALIDVIGDSSDAAQSAISLLRAAAADLRANSDFAKYDRLRFITSYANPIGERLMALQKHVGPPAAGPRRLWRVETGTPFVAGAFDPTAFAPAHARSETQALRALGERLFFDPRLSGSGERSCSTCHVPDKMFTDGLPRAKPLPGQTATLRNTPSLINVAFEPSLFAEGRTRSLETQIGVVLESRAEMASSVDRVAVRLQSDSSYRAAFASAMPDRKAAPITGLEVRQAIAVYLRSLTTFDSRFDRAMRGDTLAVTASERRGFTVFMGRGKCATCHFVPLLNGVVPPDYRAAEAEVIGVPATADTLHAKLDPDPGRARVEGVPNNEFAFKVPALRNIARTAPYMHNGVFKTLEQVVDFYDRGGAAGLGIRVASQTLSPAPLRLTPEEKRNLVAFLNALTDTTRRSRPAMHASRK